MAEKSNMASFKRAQVIFAFLFFVFLLLGCADFERDNPYDKNGINYLYGGYAGSYGLVYYDVQAYKTVAIGSQTWFADNLNYDAPGSKCYNNSSSNCAKYDRLYNWSTAMALPQSCNSNSCSEQIQSPHRGICPNGWHIPSDAEWDVLINYAGGYSAAGKHLKAFGGWSSGGNGTNQYGFSALPGGSGVLDGSFYNVSYYGD